MSDTKISLLAAATPAALTDKLPIARASANGSLTVQDVLEATGLLTAVTPAALTDALGVVRAGAGKKLTVQDVLAALTLLTAVTPAAASDELLVMRAGAAKKLTVADVLPLTERRNMLANGAFDVCQRATSYALTTTVAYGCVDRWFFRQATAAACTASQAALPVALAGFKNCLKLLLTGTSTGQINGGQVVETIDVTKWQGRSVMLYVRMLRGSTWNPANVSVQLYTGTGTDEGSAAVVAGTWTGQAATLNTTAQPPSANTWATFAFPVTIPAGCTEVAALFTAVPTGAAVDANSYLCITGAEIKEGTVAVDAYNFVPYAQELMLAQRWLPVWGAQQGIQLRAQGFATSTVTTNPLFPFKVQARVPPTALQVSAAADFSVFNFRLGTSGVATAVAFNAGSINEGLCSVSTVAGTPTLVAGDGALFSPNNTNARIVWTGAEL